MLEDQLQKDYIQAMKDRDTVKSSTVNFLRAQLKNVRIEKRSETLEDKDVVAVIKKQIKQRQDSIEQYEKGGRRDLADKETAEMAILKSYLPEELSEQALQQFIEQAIRETGAQSMKDMGSVIKAVAAKAQGRADNRVVSELVKKALAGK
ncbi:MAG: GatB/YqeY domain-containing protein [Candidatus Omnitrophica bacterium]|nr:GatB/YqeY domain-containing protein [Candidatus Omnitrophota bacterium]MBI5024614.1 GatB/YqeY domain-containing protein [Candidatus Omnitrophota bacterium]